MSDVTIHVDGSEASGPGTMTILEAAESVGIPIPTLCHIRGLMPTGGCRICVVELEGSSRLAAACHTPVSEGMVVHTRSPKVVRARRGIIQLLLAGHTGPCVSDPWAATCELHRIAAEIEAGPPAFKVQKPRTYHVETESAYVRRDLSRCILCGRCVKACGELAGEHVFATAYRGFQSKIVAGCDVPLASHACEDCGFCIRHCPTGALRGVDESKDRTMRDAPDGVNRARHGLDLDEERRERLLVLLQEAEMDSGYLSRESIETIASSMQLPTSDVYGVASFYSFLPVAPRGRHVIRVCGSVPCYLKGSEMIVQRLGLDLGIAPGKMTEDGRFSLEVVNCIGACDQGPAMLVDDELHGNLTLESVASVLERYR
jgi:predicted molibdopterin-dependent oxidoreductase YjgC